MDARLLGARRLAGAAAYKDECCFSFDSPESEDGLYVSLISFLGFGRQYVEQYYNNTGNSIFLHIQREKKPILLPEHGSEGPEKKITRLAIGVEGGFDPNSSKQKFEYINHYSIVLLPEFTIIPWPSNDLPPETLESVKSILDAESPLKLAELQALAGTWDGEIRKVSAHAANLKQLDNGVKIPPTGWQCCNCDLTNNLWLNLTDGSILCGRRFFDGTGGNDHGVQHFTKTGYPLAVKLGTITPDGKADVFSYAEDDMVEDPYLSDHLKHFGIDLQHMQKTEKSMIELELEVNQSAGEWGLLQESSSQLQPACGPRLTGLVNLGNSCYLNSVMQVLFSLPDFIKHFVDRAPVLFNSSPADPINDFNIQMAKLGVGLVSGRYAVLSDDGSQRGISPKMFQFLIGKSHPEFSTKRQQDAQEFYLYVLEVLKRNSRHIFNPASCLKFNVEERIQCSESGMVRYTNREDHCLVLNVPLIAADNKEEVEEYETKRMEAEKIGQKFDSSLKVRPHIPFQACLDSLMEEEIVEQFFSSALNKKVLAKKLTRFASFPDYLMIQLKKFTMSPDWSPVKLDVAVEMPWEMDLSELRGTGLKEDEKLLPDVTTDIPAPQYDQNILTQLIEMGFPQPACERALFYTKNSGMEEATNWIMEHLGDTDFAEPFVPPGTTKKVVVEVNENDIQMIMSMGFTHSQAKKALLATQNNIERAIDWIFSHVSESESDSGLINLEDNKDEPEFRDGNSRYKLAAFISHMGSSAHVGHYVCHILQDDRWVIFNDNRVAFSENPPKDLGYLYLYKRL